MKSNTKLVDINETTFKFTIDNEILMAEVSPCSWMYPNYGLQVIFYSKNEDNLSLGGQQRFINKSIPHSKSTIKDIIDFSKNISFSQCTTNKCKNIQFNDTTSNREGMCESCFLNKADIKYYGDLIKDSESAISNCENEISNGSLFVLETVIHSNCDDTVLYHFTKYKTDIHYINQLKEHYNADHIDYETTHIQDYLKSLKNELNIYETRKIKNKIKTF